MHRRERRKLTIKAGATALVALAAIFVVPAGAGAADGDLPDGDFVATYAGTLAAGPLPGLGVTSGPATLVVTCQKHRCQADLLGERAFNRCVNGRCQDGRRARGYADPSDFAQESAFSFSFEMGVGRDNSCPQLPVQHVAEAQLTANARTATFSYRLPALAYECPNGNVTDVPAGTTSFRGPLTDLEADEGTQSGTQPAPDEPEESGPSAAARENAGQGTPTDDEVSSSRLESGDAGAPSVLSAVPRVQDVELTGDRSLALVALVVILVLLIAFPTHLLNTAAETGQDRLAVWRRTRRGLAEASGQQPVSSRRTWGVAAGVVLVAALIGAFADPGFGFNAGSVRVIAALFLALAVEAIVVWFLVIKVTRRTSPGTVAGFRAAPATLLVVAFAVLLTRLTGFEPGIIFGLVAGVTFAAAATTAAAGRIALGGAALGYGLALVGWIGYSLIGTPPDDAGFWRAFATDTLSGLAIAGIASLPLALIPLRGLPGHTLWTWRKPVWAICYALGLVGFFIVLMPMPFSWEAVDTPLRTWVLLYLIYAAAAVIAWAAMARPWAGKDASDSLPAAPPA
jgi:hypothetical protein